MSSYKVYEPGEHIVIKAYKAGDKNLIEKVYGPIPECYCRIKEGFAANGYESIYVVVYANNAQVYCKAHQENDFGDYFENAFVEYPVHR